MKLDVNVLRYLSKEDFRVLTAVEMGQKNVRTGRGQSCMKPHAAWPLVGLEMSAHPLPHPLAAA